MSAENVKLAGRLVAELPLDGFAAALRDPNRVAEIERAMAALADPGCEIVRVGPEYAGDAVTYLGFAGFLGFWTDWLEPWDDFRIETEAFLDAGDKVVQLVRQVGRTKVGGVRVEQHGAAVMSFRDGKLTRIEFHLDRDVAMRSAGLAE